MRVINRPQGIRGKIKRHLMSLTVLACAQVGVLMSTASGSSLDERLDRDVDLSPVAMRFYNDVDAGVTYVGIELRDFGRSADPRLGQTTILEALLDRQTIEGTVDIVADPKNGFADQLVLSSDLPMSRMMFHCKRMVVELDPYHTYQRSQGVVFTRPRAVVYALEIGNTRPCIGSGR